MVFHRRGEDRLNKAAEILFENSVKTSNLSVFFVYHIKDQSKDFALRMAEKKCKYLLICIKLTFGIPFFSSLRPFFPSSGFL